MDGRIARSEHPFPVPPINPHVDYRGERVGVVLSWQPLPNPGSAYAPGRLYRAFANGHPWAPWFASGRLAE